MLILMTEFDYQNFNKVHQAVLAAIGQDYSKGHGLYKQNLALYDQLPEHPTVLKEGKLAKKLDICEAIEKATGCLGVNLTLEKGKSVSTLDSVDFVMEMMVRAAKIARDDSFPLAI